jgi:hypothetical protein
VHRQEDWRKRWLKWLAAHIFDGPQCIHMHAVHPATGRKDSHASQYSNSTYIARSVERVEDSNVVATVLSRDMDSLILFLRACGNARVVLKRPKSEYEIKTSPTAKDFHMT